MEAFEYDGTIVLQNLKQTEAKIIWVQPYSNYGLGNQFTNAIFQQNKNCKV